MAYQSFYILQTQPAATAGVLGKELKIEIQPKILGQFPLLGVVPSYRPYLSTWVPTIIEEGRARWYIDRKEGISIYDTTEELTTKINGVDVSNRVMTAAPFKTRKKDEFNHTIDGGYDFAFAYDLIKDGKNLETRIISDTGDVMSEVREQKSRGFWTTLRTDIIGGTSKLYPLYVSVRDKLTKASPTLFVKTSVAAATTLDEQKLRAINILNKMFDARTDIKKFARLGDTHEGYPYVRGTKGIEYRFVVSSYLVPILSLDSRFIPIGKANEMLVKRYNDETLVGFINGTPVYTNEEKDLYFPEASWLLYPTGRYGAVAEVEEIVDKVAVFPNANKPTREVLTEGHGAWDHFVLPFVNLVRGEQLTFAPATAPRSLELNEDQANFLQGEPLNAPQAEAPAA